jgi:two-component system cell cycle sensor histidine kinase/response regulator CckA
MQPHRGGRTGEALPRPGAAPHPAGGATVLVVEDNDQLRLLARLALEVHGYTVIDAAGGELALEIARQHLGAIQVLVTDIQIPGIRGPELAARIASLRPGIKILFMSGYLGGAMADHDDLAPEAAFLEKPFSIEAFARKVRQLLDA